MQRKIGNMQQNTHYSATYTKFTFNGSGDKAPDKLKQSPPRYFKLVTDVRTLGIPLDDGCLGL